MREGWSWGRRRPLVGRQAGEVAEQGHGAVDVGGLAPAGQRARAGAGPRQAVVAPLARRQALEEVRRL